MSTFSNIFPDLVYIPAVAAGTSTSTTTLGAVLCEVASLVIVSTHNIAANILESCIVLLPHLRHSTSAAERGSGQSRAIWPSMLHVI